MLCRKRHPGSLSSRSSNFRFHFRKTSGKEVGEGSPSISFYSLGFVIIPRKSGISVNLFSLSSLLNHHRSVFFNVRWIVEIVLIKEQQHSEYVCFRREYQTIEFAFKFELDFELDFELKIELDMS